MAQKTITYKNILFTLSYSILKPQDSKQDKQQDLVILHGWGANKNLMQNAFKETFKAYTHYYIDLPGFGNSAIPPFALHTKDYAEIIKLLLKALHLNIAQVTLLGHSFGGKVGVLLNPKQLILLSSAGILTPKPLKVRLKITITKAFKWIPFMRRLTYFLRSKDVENSPEVLYQTFKNVVDEDFMPIFATFKNPCYIFWGKEDLTTPLSAGEKLHICITGSKFFVLNGDHFFFLKQGKEIETLINDNL